MKKSGYKSSRKSHRTHAGIRVLFRRLSALFVLAALMYSAPPTFRLALAKSPTPPSLVSTATRAGRLEVFDDTWATINEHYYDSRFRGLDWDAQRVAFRNEAAEAGSSRELYAVLRRMIGTLNDPHTRVFSPEDKFDWWHPRFITIGLGIREIDGLATVVKVEPNSAPARAGICPGDVIDSVDGQPASSVVNQRLTSATAAAAERTRAFASMFDGPAETSLDLGWKDKHGQQRHARFQRYWQQRELSLSFNKESGKYLIIEIDAFTRPIAISFARILKEKLRRTRGLVIDLRNNGGGDAEAMSEMASSFLGAGVSLGEFSDRSGAGFSVFTSFLTAQPVAINVPIIVLTSERTASAAEIFVAAVRKAKRATIIGTQTCGCVLAIRTRHNLPDGGVLDVSELDYKTPAGDRLEGNGIQPDQAVMINRKDLYAKRDAALAYALRELAQSQSQPQR
jgi:carboxyl-terminal processing protease